MSLKINGYIDISANPPWHPIVNSIIVVHHNTINDLFIGRVYNVIDDNVIIISLMNNTDYIDEYVVSHNIVPDANNIGYMAVFPSYGWRYVNKKKLDQLLGTTNGEGIYYDPSNIKQLSPTIPPDDSLLDKKGNASLDDLFKDKNINQKFYSTEETFEPLDDSLRELLYKKINLSETISNEDAKIIVNTSVYQQNIIKSKEDELHEGIHITNWISKHLVNVKTNNMYIFGDLKMSIFNGYVHIARKGIKTDDVINKEMIPNLKYFKWQVGQPIDYDTLKYILFQNPLQRAIGTNIDEQKEAEMILMQEYLIALQPMPNHYMWALKRCIMCWYGDLQLTHHIRKIKILINQWRSRSDQDFNKKNGVLPSIVIYPRYGKDSAKLVMNKLSKYFLYYQNIGWQISEPSYFVKINNLLWYTNGSTDLKLYYRKVQASYNGRAINNSFKDNFTRIGDADRLLYQEG